jgi:protoporphyrin/coproporphyrin ferrochelatase
MEKIGVLLMAYGGPDSLDDVEPYLLDIRGGRVTPPALVEEIKERYAAIGGRSPLLEITNRQAKALESELNRRHKDRLHFTAYVGMRHWAPRIHQAVDQLIADGIHKAVAIVMAPHYSKMSTEKYFNHLYEAIQELGAQGSDRDLQIMPIHSWHDHPGLISAISEQARHGLSRFEGSSPFVIFSAHSLPARIMEEGDPYASQLHETARLTAQTLGISQDRWIFSFQSAGQTGDTWLGPHIEEVVAELAQKGEKELLVTPVGFVSDHVEVLFDIDIEAKQIAAEYGARLERSPSLNDTPGFISALADLATDRINLPVG